MDLGQLGAFIVLSVTLACTPGADWAYIISSALRPGSYRAAVWGLLSGYLVHTGLLVGGVAALVSSSPTLLAWLTTAGSGYLLWLGLSTLRSWRSARFYTAPPHASARTADPSAEHMAHAPGSPRARTLTAPRTERRAESASRMAFTKGLLTSATNPKVLLLYMALIPQFLNASRALPLPLQTALFGLGHFAVSVVVYFAVAKAARVLLRSRPAAARAVTLFSGVIMLLIALGLIYEQFFAR